jgi:2-iminoacetate synthase ThiH
VPSFVGIPKTKRVTRAIYGLNEETGEHKTWPSVRACLADLENYRNFNQNSLLLRIKHKQAYKGYLVAMNLSISRLNTQACLFCSFYVAPPRLVIV